MDTPVLPSAPLVRSRRRKWLRRFGMLLIVVLLFTIYLAIPGSHTVTISKETTYVTGPLDSEGRIDYPAALHEQASQGIKPEENANVLLWQAIGPKPEGSKLPERYFEFLGVPEPPEDREYFVGWTKYCKEQNLLDKDRDRQLEEITKWPWQSADYPKAAEWLKKNSRTLNLVHDAVQRPKYYNPLVPEQNPQHTKTLIDSLLPNVQINRQLSQGLIARAMNHLAEGRTDEAWKDLDVVMKLGRHVQHGSTLIEHLVGTAIQSLSIHAQIVMIQHIEPDRQLVEKRLALLNALPPIRSTGDAIGCERFFILDVAQMVTRFGFQQLEMLDKNKEPSYLNRLFERGVNWDEGLKKINQYYDRMVRIHQITSVKARKVELDALMADLKQVKLNVVSEERQLKRAIGSRTTRGMFYADLLLGYLLPAISKVIVAEDRLRQQLDNLQVVYALSAYRAERGRYPEKLDQLAPDYLKTIPMDRFNEEPLIYKPDGKTGYRFYSVGPNGIDDEGIQGLGKADDAAVILPLKSPQELAEEKLVKQLDDCIVFHGDIQEFMRLSETVRPDYYWTEFSESETLVPFQIAFDAKLPDNVVQLAYWMKPTKGREMKVIGLVQTSPDNVQLFHGTLLPP